MFQRTLRTTILLSATLFVFACNNPATSEETDAPAVDAHVVDDAANTATEDTEEAAEADDAEAPTNNAAPADDGSLRLQLGGSGGFGNNYQGSQPRLLEGDLRGPQ